MSLKTNAPPHWPEPAVDELLPNNALNVVRVSSELLRQFREEGIRAQVVGMYESLMFDEGILQSHFTVKDSGVDHHIFLYNTDDDTNGAHFTAVKALIDKIKGKRAVYYSMTDLATDLATTGGEISPLRMFAPDLLSRYKGDFPNGEYSMWWKSSDIKFSDSDEFRYITEYYDKSHRIATYIYAEILKSIGGVEEDVKRVSLPKEPVSLGVRGPESVAILLNVSEVKGVRFHFNEELTTPRYRSLFWKHFSDYAAYLRSVVIRDKAPLDLYKDESPKHWWAVSSGYAKKKDNNREPVLKFGTMT